MAKTLGKQSKSSETNYLFNYLGGEKNLIVEIDQNKKILSIFYTIDKNQNKNCFTLKDLYPHLSKVEKDSLVNPPINKILKHDFGRKYSVTSAEYKMKFIFNSQRQKRVKSILMRFE